MNSTVEKALKLWGMEMADVRLAAARENRVYHVELNGNAFALRLHRQNLREDRELWSELQWMNAVARRGVHVPTPIGSLTGEFLHRVDGVQVDMLTWLAGTPFGATGTALQFADRAATFRKLGIEMANLHKASDDWPLPEGFFRQSWDRPGLLGDDPLWGRFWENPSLSERDRELMASVRDIGRAELQSIEADLDYGLIHADLVRENVIIDGNRLHFIDFDDGGFGFRLFDLATALIKNLDEPDYPVLKAALLEGYLAVREMDVTHLDLFILLRSATYVGWIIPRMEEEGAQTRNARFMDTARKLAREYLGKQSS